MSKGREKRSIWAISDQLSLFAMILQQAEILISYSLFGLFFS